MEDIDMDNQQNFNSIDPNTGFVQNQQPDMNQTQMPGTNFQGGSSGIQERSIPMCIILSLVTCGIYGLIWFYNLTEDSNKVGDSKTASGGLAILYTLLSCGIYGIYWFYKLGAKIGEAQKKYGTGTGNDSAVLYLILSLVGLGIVPYILAQSELNKIAHK